MKRPLGNLHIFNKPNKELISINKSVLIGLRKGLAWGLQTSEEVEKKKALGDFRFSASLDLQSALHKALVSFWSTAFWSIHVHVLLATWDGSIFPPGFLPHLLSLSVWQVVQPSGPLFLDPPKFKSWPWLLLESLEQLSDHLSLHLLSCERGSWWFLNRRVSVRITCWEVACFWIGPAKWRLLIAGGRTTVLVLTGAHVSVSQIFSYVLSEATPADGTGECSVMWIFSQNLNIPTTKLSYQLPRWHGSKESACQCRRCKRHGLDPWLGGDSPGGGNDNTLQHSCLGEFHGQRSLEDFRPWGWKESDTTELKH